MSPEGLPVALDATPSTLVPAFAVGLAAVHLFAGTLRFVETIPRSRWLSLSGGVSVAYVFVHVLPELEVRGSAVAVEAAVLASFAERHVYLVALAGFVTFYGVERFVAGVRDRSRPAGRNGTDRGRSTADGDAGSVDALVTDEGVFWVHVGSFALYNGLIGYLLVHREEPGLASLVFFGTAMALHFFVNDFGLREYHEERYHRFGRWVLAAAVLVGTAVGYRTALDERAIGVLFAFLAGGVVLNVIKEELPEERQSRFWAFALGAGGYAALLVFV